ncbi:MAG: endonuclease/exonuclease/phosphatase family protein [Rhodobacteraceae bacterium]|jgi:hypothetical protein|nr:endonuclease/exonuclease/phosphatase family protein [Paracoccaceae bacterium]
MLLCTAGTLAAADPLRIATYHTELGRDGPGLMLADILSGSDPQVAAVAAVIAAADADVLVLQGIDWDLRGSGLGALADVLRAGGADYPHRVALRPNAGMATGLDMDGDGRTARRADAQGWGAFAGAGGMALLSRLPLAQVTDLSALLWADLPGADLPVGMAAEVRAVQRLSSVAHWDVEVSLPDGGALHVLVWHGAPPIPDGAAARNLRRGGDEARVWRAYLDGALPWSAPAGPVAVMGIANIDPVDGDGRHDAVAALLADPRLSDPAPRSAGGAAAADAAHGGDPARDTASFPDGPGNLRVSYILPDARLAVEGSGVLWPAPDDPLAEVVAAASRHRLVWVDVDVPEPSGPDRPAVVAEATATATGTPGP